MFFPSSTTRQLIRIVSSKLDLTSSIKMLLDLFWIIGEKKVPTYRGILGLQHRPRRITYPGSCPYWRRGNATTAVPHPPWRAPNHQPNYCTAVHTERRDRIRLYLLMICLCIWGASNPIRVGLLWWKRRHYAYTWEKRQCQPVIPLNPH
jgi:hypothetical protein